MKNLINKVLTRMFGTNENYGITSYSVIVDRLINDGEYHCSTDLTYFNEANDFIKIEATEIVGVNKVYFDIESAKKSGMFYRHTTIILRELQAIEDKKKNEYLDAKENTDLVKDLINMFY